MSSSQEWIWKGKSPPPPKIINIDDPDIPQDPSLIMPDVPDDKDGPTQVLTPEIYGHAYSKELGPNQTPTPLA